MAKAIIEHILREFLQSIGQQVGLKNFLVYVELRVDNEGVIYPIEINPLRFGGWCTTGDLLGRNI